MLTVSNIGIDLNNLILEAEELVERRKPEALLLAERAMLLALQTKEPRNIAYAKYIVAFYHCLVVNDYDRAIQLCNDTLKEYEANDIADVVYKIYMTLGNAYHLKGDAFSAHDNYLKGLKKLEARNELTIREKGFAASFYYNASLLLIAEQNEAAEEYLLRAIEIYKEIESGFKLSKSYCAYSAVLKNRGEFEQAIELLFKALEIDQRINDPYSIALTKANLGILSLRTGKLDEAFNWLTDSLGYYTDNQMEYEMAMTKVSMGETLFAIGRQDEAIEQMLEAEELFNKLENKRELSGLYKSLADFFGKLEDYKCAWEYEQKHSESLKYFFNIERENAVTRARKEFETGQKEKEAELLKAKNEEIQLYVRKLESSNNELKRFAHVASHDLREPLRMVNSYMNLLLKSMKGNITETQAEFIAFAIDGSKRMDQLIIDLLSLARVDRDPRIAKVNLRTVFEEIALNLDALIKEKNATIKLPDHLPEIMADRTQMLQVFQNLIANGIKYNTSETPAIEIQCIKRKNDIEILVADNGVGISEEFRGKVFEIFQRLNSVKDAKGSGIGLSIAKKIVDSLNGKIWIEDNQPRGCVFAISLPVSLIVNV